MADWYVVQTKARQEGVAKEHLGRQSFDAYLPLIKNARLRKGQWRSNVEPLFPGYLFISLNLPKQNTAPIRSTRGVIGLVRFGDRLLPVPDSIVETLLNTQNGENEPIDSIAFFKKGDSVRLVEGPLRGVSAIFSATDGRERVALLLTLLGRTKEVVVPRDAIALAN